MAAEIQTSGHHPWGWSAEAVMSLSTLCQRCGLCCDGNLFSKVPLRRTEIAAMERLGLAVIKREDGTSPGFTQRCTALEGTCCKVYAERPEICRRYTCFLLTALAEGETSLDDALRVVDEAHARIRAVESLLPPAPADAPRAVLQRAQKADLPESGGPLPPPLRETWLQVESYLDHHFRGRHRRER